MTFRDLDSSTAERLQRNLFKKLRILNESLDMPEDVDDSPKSLWHLTWLARLLSAQEVVGLLRPRAETQEDQVWAEGFPTLLAALYTQLKPQLSVRGNYDEDREVIEDVLDLEMEDFWDEVRELEKEITSTSDLHACVEGMYPISLAEKEFSHWHCCKICGRAMREFDMNAKPVDVDGSYEL